MAMGKGGKPRVIVMTDISSLESGILEPDDAQSRVQYANPVIRGFAADPSICRVGEDYYLAVSSFEYFPGIPLFHSRDLVNWEQAGNAVGFDNAVCLDGAGESGGIWAPTIRYYEGKFYITAAMERTGGNAFGNFIISAGDIRGPWSEPAGVDIGGIDPSLFFEDGKAYYCTNDNSGEGRETIKLGVINPDTGEILEAFRPVWHGAGGGWTEAPHIYHIGEWYYLLCAEGGTAFGHHEVAARAKDIWGPYESCPYNPILTNRNDTGKQVLCCGHGDLTEDREGNWWMVFLGQRPVGGHLSQLGRETFLMPVVWRDGWPMGQGGKACILAGSLGNVPQRAPKAMEDSFETAEWPCQWRFVRNPNLPDYVRGDGRLLIRPFGGKPQALHMGGFVCVRQPDFEFRMEAWLDFSPGEEGEAAGLVIWLSHAFYYFFGVRRAEGKRMLFLERRMGDMDVIPWTEEIDRAEPHSGNICAKTQETGIGLVVKGGKEEYLFGVVMPESADGVIWKSSASARFLSTEMPARCFTGTMAGLYVESMEESGSPGIFSEFRIESGCGDAAAAKENRK